MGTGAVLVLLGAGAEERVRPGCAKGSVDSLPQQLPMMCGYLWFGRESGEGCREGSMEPPGYWLLRGAGWQVLPAHCGELMDGGLEGVSSVVASSCFEMSWLGDWILVCQGGSCVIDLYDSKSGSCIYYI